MPIRNLLVVDNPATWNIPLESVEVLSARAYLSPDGVSKYFGARVFNLCRSYAYQSLGYYVSLLAEARGQRAIPSVTTLRDFGSPAVARSLAEEIDKVVQDSLKDQPGREVSISIFFGQSLQPHFARLATNLYRLFPSPLLKVTFSKTDRWFLSKVAPLATNQIPETDRSEIVRFASIYFGKKRQPGVIKNRFLYDLAIYLDPSEVEPPSDPEAIQLFTKAAREMGFHVETITRSDIDRISEFDALFIRSTTSVNHPTYRLSRLAHAEGVIVIDDPWSILRCSNKIYLAESLARAKIPAPETRILTREDLRPSRLSKITLPVILKIPDGAFSRGVRRAETPAELEALLKQMLKDSDLVIAQEFTPSEFDWRIGILDHQPLFACRYHMAPGHWQIYNWAAADRSSVIGKSETIHIELAPPKVVEIALRAARLIGDGLYGVDLKQIGNRILVIEVNDNPSIESDVEDACLGMELYRRIARVFRKRIEQARS
ncbi:MAG: RimK family protein [Puniceicoccaceae bacterium]